MVPVGQAREGSQDQQVEELELEELQGLQVQVQAPEDRLAAEQASVAQEQAESLDLQVGELEEQVRVE